MSKNAQTTNHRAFMHKIIPYRYCYEEAGMQCSGAQNMPDTAHQHTRHFIKSEDFLKYAPNIFS